MTSLVTGATGFLGRNLTTALVQSGERVVAFGRADRRPSPSAGVTWVNAGLNTFDHWEALLEDVSTIYHLAWSSLPQSANADPFRDASTNILTTLRLLEGLRSRPGVRFVFLSSGGTVYGHLEVVPVPEEHPTKPLTAYGISKLTIENYLNFFGDAHGLDPVSLRISIRPRTSLRPRLWSDRYAQRVRAPGRAHSHLRRRRNHSRLHLCDRCC